jgi:hypothetical protein
VVDVVVGAAAVVAVTGACRTVVVVAGIVVAGCKIVDGEVVVAGPSGTTDPPVWVVGVPDGRPAAGSSMTTRRVGVAGLTIRRTAARTAIATPVTTIAGAGKRRRIERPAMLVTRRSRSTSRKGISSFRLTLSPISRAVG